MNAGETDIEHEQIYEKLLDSQKALTGIVQNCQDKNKRAESSKEIILQFLSLINEMKRRGVTKCTVHVNTILSLDVGFETPMKRREAIDDQSRYSLKENVKDAFQKILSFLTTRPIKVCVEISSTSVSSNQ